MTPDDLDNVPPVNLQGDETDQKVSFPDIKSTFILFLSFILNNLVAIIIVSLIFQSLRINPQMLSLMYAITLLLTINSALKKAKKRNGYPLKINFNKIQLWLIPLIIIGAFSLIVPIAQISVWMPMPESVRKIFERTFTKDIFSISTVIIAAPVLEEILCRGIILKGLLLKYPPYKAIIISAIFFGVLHLNPWQAIPASLVGLFLGWLYYKTKSVIPGMIVHATINIIATLRLFFLTDQKNLMRSLSTPIHIILVLGSLLMFSLICIVIHRTALTNQNAPEINPELF